MEPSWSLPIGVQLWPASWVRQSPPEGAQAHHSSGLPGRATRRFSLPVPPSPVGPNGPAYSQLASSMLRWAASSNRSSSARSRARRMTPLLGRKPFASTRGDMKLSQRWNGLKPFPLSNGSGGEVACSEMTESNGTVPSRIAALQWGASCACRTAGSPIKTKGMSITHRPGKGRLQARFSFCGARGIACSAFHPRNRERVNSNRADQTLQGVSENPPRPRREPRSNRTYNPQRTQTRRGAGGCR